MLHQLLLSLFLSGVAASRLHDLLRRSAIRQVPEVELHVGHVHQIVSVAVVVVLPGVDDNPANQALLCQVLVCCFRSRVAWPLILTYQIRSDQIYMYLAQPGGQRWAAI